MCCVLTFRRSYRTEEVIEALVWPSTSGAAPVPHAYSHTIWVIFNKSVEANNLCCWPLQIAPRTSDGKRVVRNTCYSNVTYVPRHERDS